MTAYEDVSMLDRALAESETRWNPYRHGWDPESGYHYSAGYSDTRFPKRTISAAAIAKAAADEAQEARLQEYLKISPYNLFDDDDDSRPATPFQMAQDMAVSQDLFGHHSDRDDLSDVGWGSRSSSRASNSSLGRHNPMYKTNLVGRGKQIKGRY